MSTRSLTPAQIDAMSTQEYVAHLIAQEPPLTEAQIEAAARILAGFPPASTSNAAA